VPSIDLYLYVLPPMPDPRLSPHHPPAPVPLPNIMGLCPAWFGPRFRTADHNKWEANHRDVYLLFLEDLSEVSGSKYINTSTRWTQKFALCTNSDGILVCSTLSLPCYPLAT
jgi:hypothetical protein